MSKTDEWHSTRVHLMMTQTELAEHEDRDRYLQKCKVRALKVPIAEPIASHSFFQALEGPKKEPQK